MWGKEKQSSSAAIFFLWCCVVSNFAIRRFSNSLDKRKKVWNSSYVTSKFVSVSFNPVWITQRALDPPWFSLSSHFLGRLRILKWLRNCQKSLSHLFKVMLIISQEKWNTRKWIPLVSSMKNPSNILSFLIKFHPAVKTPKPRKDFLVLSQSNWGQMLTLLHSSLMLEQGKGKGFGP